MITPGSASSRPAGRVRYAGRSKPDETMVPGATGCGERVSAVAGLDERVGPEAQAHFALDDVVDDRRVGPGIEVVHQLCALVAEEAGVLELCGAFHGFRRY